MANPGFSLDNRLTPKEELIHFKAVVRSVVIDASEVLANIELLSHAAELEAQIVVLDHCLDYIRRLCEGDIQESGDKEAE